MSFRVSPAWLVMMLWSTAGAQSVYWAGSEGIGRTNTVGLSVETLIPIGYHPAAGAVEFDPVHSKLYWAVPGGIERSDPDGAGLERFLHTPGITPQGLAIDPIGGHIYWSVTGAAPGAGRIQWADLDGANAADLITGLFSPRGLAIEPTFGRVYWAEPNLNVPGQVDAVRRASLDGSGVEDVIATGLQHPVDVAIDSLHHKVYVADNGGPSSPSIRRADLDGANVQVLVNRLNVSVLSPETIVVDPPSGKMFWSNQSYGLWSAGLDGTGVVNVRPHPGLPWLPGLALDPGAGHLFWSDSVSQTIYRTSVLGTSFADLFPSLIERPLAIASEPASTWLYWTEGPVYPRSDWRIQRGATSGGMVEELPLVGDSIWHLALDSSASILYWASNHTIMSSRTDGIQARTLVNLSEHQPSSPERPYALALDAGRGQLYVGVSLYPPQRGTAFRIDARTGDFLTPAIPYGFSTVRGMALDIPGNSLYWAGMRFGDRVLALICRIDLQGGEPECVFEQEEYSFGDVSMAVDPLEKKLYWVNSEYEGIARLDLETRDWSILDSTPATGIFFDGCGLRTPASLGQLRAFAPCFTGPVGIVESLCVCSDLTGDWRVDLRDASALQLAFVTSD